MADQNVIDEGNHRALDNDLILEHIFEYCSTSTLSSCRLVCSLWKMASNIKWKTSVGITLKTSQIAQFAERFTLTTEAENPFTFFRLRGSVDLVGANKFREICGANLKVLELRETHFDSNQTFRQLVYRFTPNLEKLVLNKVTVRRTFRTESERLWQNFQDTLDLHWEEDDHVENWRVISLTVDNVAPRVVSWTEILRRFPGLKTINLSGEVARADEFFEALGTIRSESAARLMLKEVNVINGDAMHPALLDVISNPNLQLETLSIAINGLHYSLQLGRILRTNAPSLKKLTLSRSFLEEKYLDPFPIIYQVPQGLHNLRTLVLPNRVFQSLAFLRLTPNLEKLIIQDDSSNEQMSIVAMTTLADLHSVRLNKCRELEYTKRLPVEDLHKLMDWMPNVEKLKLVLNDKTFALVCERWGNLVSLEVTAGSSVSESGITGMRPDDVAMFNSGHTNVPIRQGKANITNLKHLRHLSLVADPIFKFSLGSCGAVYGIQKLENLQHLLIDPQGYLFKTKSDRQIWNDLSSQHRWF